VVPYIYYCIKKYFNGQIGKNGKDAIEMNGYQYIKLSTPHKMVTGRFHVCTVATKKTKSLDQLLESCRHSELAITVLGLDKPYPASGIKLIYIQNFVDQLPDDDIVLFIDAYDVLVLASPKTILETFLKMDVSCIYGAEPTCFPFPEFKDLYPASPTKFRFLNAGTVMAYAGYLKAMLARMKPKKSLGEQLQVSRYYIHHQNEIALDYQARLFLSLHHLLPQEIAVDFEKKQVHCLLTGTTPCIIHGNSRDGKKYYQQLYEALFG
jgi:hypothetical protein